MHCKTLIIKGVFCLFLGLNLGLIALPNVEARLKTISLKKLAKVVQDEPSRRFGSDAPSKPSLRFIPTSTDAPSRRFGGQQVGEASLEVIRRKVAKVPPGPEELVTKADKLVDDGETIKALEIYRKVISSSPKTTSAHFGLANALIKAGDYDDALQELNKALEVAPNNSEGQINLGVIYYRKNEVKKAISHYEKLLDIVKDKEDLAATYYNLAIAYSHNGELEKGLIHYQNALKTLKIYPQAHNNLGLVYETVASNKVEIAGKEADSTKRNSIYAEAEQDFKLARESFLTALEQSKNNYPLAHYNLARSYNALGDRDKATEELLTAIKQKSDFAEAYLNLGNIYLIKKRTSSVDETAKAIASFKKALEIRKDIYPLAHENLAIALGIIGNQEEAYIHYRKAINQYTEPTINTLVNVMATARKTENVRIGDELSRSETANNLKAEKNPQKLIEELTIILEQYEELDDEIKQVPILRYCAGHAYVGVGNWFQAIEEFDAAWELSKKTDKDALDSLKAVLELVKYY